MQCVATVLIVLCGLAISSHAKENQCTESKDSCPDDSTCCVLSNCSFGCCPIQNAVCCGDSVHCCPYGYTCDVIKGRCNKTAEYINMISNIPATKTSIAGECIKGVQTEALLDKISALKTKISAPLQPPYNILCPDLKAVCSNNEKCCRMRGGVYSCCRFRRGICCRSGIWCCPGGTICDEVRGRCLRISLSITVSEGKYNKTAEKINMIEKIPAIKTSAELKYIHCPDGSSCFDYETCCELANGHYGCCPYSEGRDCCSDDEHCCPAGFRCDLTAQMCVTGNNVRLPMLKKAKYPRQPKTQQVNLDEKIHFVAAQAHGGDPVTDDD